MKTDAGFLDDRNFTGINLIRLQFDRMDETMAGFLHQFAGQLETPVNGTLSGERQVSAAPLQLFTHVITHEFHHKGEIMLMCRL
jgi:uncharacterized damage-inducible protein DinB